MRTPALLLAFLLIVSWCNPPSASAQAPVLYGAPVTVDAARRIAAAAVAEARRNNWLMAVAVVDIAGELVYFERMDGTQAASIDIAQDKARSSARFKRPTRAFQDEVAKGGEGNRFLGLRGAVPAEGGLPIVVDGRIVGAVGLSGGTGAQDVQCATAGLAALGK